MQTTDEQKSSISETNKSESKISRLDVTSFVDLSISNWGKWGFNANKVIRSPRAHFIYRVPRPEFYLVNGLSQSINIKGELYLLDESFERIIEKVSLAVYLIAILFFAAMLQSAYIGMNITAVIFFILIYFITDGFMVWMFRIFGKNKKLSEIAVPLKSITRMACLMRQGILMLSWTEKETSQAVAFRSDPASTLKIIEAISPELPTGVGIIKLEKHTLSSPPPSDLKAP